ncbi:hypothetical protein GCM10010499_34590 [Streptomyces thermoviolaceus subsp. apingens]|nr:hypothetical protein GCM10010499_34590 [Streptomyces thermoviolaceus subsp. apingens]
MGRDGVLPRRVCGRLDTRLCTPVLDLWLVVGVVHLCVLTGGLRREPPEPHLAETEEQPVGASI